MRLLRIQKYRSTLMSRVSRPVEYSSTRQPSTRPCARWLLSSNRRRTRVDCWAARISGY